MHVTPEQTVSGQMTPPRRFLVVDDNRDSAAAFRPDVILLDIGLPNLNGYEAARKIRAQPWGKKIVLVALTGWDQDEDRQRSRAAGFNGHVVKPVDLAALMKLLAEPQPTPV